MALGPRLLVGDFRIVWINCVWQSKLKYLEIENLQFEQTPKLIILSIAFIQTWCFFSALTMSCSCQGKILGLGLGFLHILNCLQSWDKLVQIKIHRISLSLFSHSNPDRYRQSCVHAAFNSMTYFNNLYCELEPSRDSLVLSGY
jgi:hypothetical protein